MGAFFHTRSAVRFRLRHHEQRGQPLPKCSAEAHAFSLPQRWEEGKSHQQRADAAVRMHTHNIAGEKKGDQSVRMNKNENFCHRASESTHELNSNERSAFSFCNMHTDEEKNPLIVFRGSCFDERIADRAATKTAQGESRRIEMHHLPVLGHTVYFRCFCIAGQFTIASNPPMTL